MLHHRQYAPPPVRSLVNHLGAAFAACEALLAAHQAAVNPHDVLRLELTAIAHVLQAREDMRDLKLSDRAVRSQITLFLTVTDCLEDTTPSSAATIGTEAETTRMIGGRIDVATLMALIAAMDDIVGLCFLAFEDHAPEAGRQSGPVITETLVWATAHDST